MKNYKAKHLKSALVVLVLMLTAAFNARAVQLSGTYTIDSSSAATATNFRNLNSAITYMVGSGNRSDGGPANSAPFGVSGPVVFNYTGSINIHNDQIEIPVIPGASGINTITINGNGRTIQAACNATLPYIVRLSGADFIRLQNCTLRTTTTTHGWGIHLWQNADSNIFTNNVIDLSAVTTTSSTAAVGITFTNSNTNVTTSGANGRDNLFFNNTVVGHPTTGAPFYAVTICPQSSAATYSGNKFYGTVLRNIFSYGFYLTNTNSTVISGSEIFNTTRTSLSTFYGISVWNGSRNDSIVNNKIYNTYQGVPTSGNTFYGISYFTPNTPVGNPGLCANNVIYNIRHNGPYFGIYSSSANNVRFYHNTIAYDHPTSTAGGTVQTYGFYHVGAPSGNGIDFRNNVISINRGGTALIYNVFVQNAGTLFNFNKNVYFRNNRSGAFVGHYNGMDIGTFSQWRTTNNGIFDSNSVFINPVFQSLANNDYRPTEGFINNMGDNLNAFSPRDLNDSLRSTTPDPGAFEFTPTITTDIGVAEIIPPAAPFAAGTYPINVRIRNSGTSAVTSATINWSLNGTPQTPFAWTGTLNAASQSANVNIGNITIAPGIGYSITAWTSNPNNTTDQNLLNDTNTVGNIFAQVPGGTYTINRLAAPSASNFSSVAAFADAITFGGISGAITANVVANSGPYTEQVFFGSVPNASSTNSITVNGNGEFVQFNVISGPIGIINLVGTDFITFNNLGSRSLSPSFGVGYLLTAGTDSVSILGCTIDISSVTGSSSSAGIAVTGSLTSPVTSASNVARWGNFSNNIITGSATGGPFYGITLLATNASNAPNNNFVVRNNIIRDFSSYGMYIQGTANSVIASNHMSRPTRNFNTTIYGIYGISSMSQDTIENNIITQPFEGSQISTSQFFGMYFIATNIPANRQCVVRNNLITDIKSNGAVYGIYMLSATNINFLHNTIIVDHPTSTATGVTQLYYNSGTPTTQTLRNNLFFMNRGGSGVKHIIHLATVAATGYVLSNNNYHFKVPAGSTNNHTGFYNATNRTTLADWQANVPFDLNSNAADPMFRTYITATPFMPGNDTLNNAGFNTFALAPRDFTGALRSTTPDIGAVEFSAPADDAGLTRILSPLSPIQLGAQNVTAMLRNYGRTNITSANLEWSVNDTLQTPSSYFGNLAPNDSAVATLGLYNFANNGFFRIKAWSAMPNAAMDSFPFNDTTTITVCTALDNNLTVNPSAPASGTNFTSMSALVFALNSCGISGPTTVTIAPGTYTGQLAFTGNIPGSNSVNTVSFIGADSATTLITSNGAPTRPTLLLDGTKNMTFRNIKFITTSASAGTAVQLINGADSNTFVRCSFIAPYSTGTGTNAFVASGSLVGFNTVGNAANHLLIDSCIATGGYAGIAISGIASQKSLNNMVRRSTVINSHWHGIYAQQQNGIKILNNLIQDIGVVGSNINPICINLLSSDNANHIIGNNIQNTLGGRGIDVQNNLGAVNARQVFANNMINIGAASNLTYGIFELNNGFTDIAHNTVKLNTAEPNYGGAAWYSNNTNSTLYNDIKIVNNIFAAPSGCLSVYVVNNAFLTPANYTVNHNVYFSTNTYPWRVGGFITNTLVNFATAANMMGPLLNNNVNSQFFLPTFFSSTNLRSVSPQLDDSGMVVTTVPFDIDGRPRGTTATDIGIYEFSKPANDAGVVTILEPARPKQAGLTDVRVVIKNFGTATITSAEVTYQIDTVIRTRLYTGTLAVNATDTVVFDSTSGPAGSDQRYNFTGSFINVKSWTSNPNFVLDSLNANDTAFTSLCGSLLGTYTINPAGSGSTNFTSLQAAIDRLACGGISGPVVFNIAPGTYTGQFSIGNIAGANANNTVTFKSANNNAASVNITNAAGTAIDNFTVRGLGLQFVNFEHLTMTNSNASFGRIFVINKETSTNTNCANLNFRNVTFNGVNTTSTADAMALVFGPNGDNATFINFTHCTFNNGSMGIYLGGQNIVNQNAPGMNVDTCTFNNQYYAGIWLINRFLTNIRGNVINGHPTFTNYYNIYISGFGQNSEITRNICINPAGFYGMFITQNAYYDAPGLTTVANNLVHMESLTNTQYGLYVSNSNKMRIYNNTLRLNTTSTASYPFFMLGHATFLAGATNYPASYDFIIKNNIFHSVNGYAYYLGNIQAVQSIQENNRNLYWSGNTNAIFINGLNYGASTFYTTYRNAINSGSDRKSIWGEPAYLSATNSRLNPANAAVWLANGRAEQIFNLPNDLAGNARSTTVANGTPDIGAYEVTPTATPPALLVTDSIFYGVSQYVIDHADTIAKITWGQSGFLPNAITARFYPGTLINDPTNNGNNTGAHIMNCYWRIDTTGGSGYTADVELRYDPIHLGTIPNESSIVMARRYSNTNGTWTHYNSFLSVVDTINNRFSVAFLPDLGEFTGTSELEPLPVRLSNFTANRSNNDAVLNWTTASEINSRVFEIERLDANRRYVTIGSVNAAGNSSNARRYQFIDENAARAISGKTAYYRLKMIDRDGTFEYSELRAVNFETRISRNNVLAYPNPFTADINLNIEAIADAKANIAVYDLTGRLIASKDVNITTGTNLIALDELSGANNGVYIVKTVIDGVAYSEKVIKQ